MGIHVTDCNRDMGIHVTDCNRDDMGIHVTMTVIEMTCEYI